jgi:hypothetical protein
MSTFLMDTRHLPFGLFLVLVWKAFSATVTDWNTPVRATGRHGYREGATTGWDIVKTTRRAVVPSDRAVDNGIYTGRHRCPE